MAVWLRKCASFEEEAIADRQYWQQFSPDERVAQIEDLLSEWSRIKGDAVELENRDFAEFFARLNANRVRALIVGAYAFAFHVKPRYAATIEILADRPVPDPPGARILPSIDDVTFEDAWASRVAGKYAGVEVFYIGREALIRNKAASGRPQDLADLAALR